MQCNGACTTLMTGTNGKAIQCPWKMVDVSRSLHSVTHITGSIDQRKHDVLINNTRSVVAQAGVVDKALNVIDTTIGHPRQGNLHTVEAELQRFHQPGANQ